MLNEGARKGAAQRQRQLFVNHSTGGTLEEKLKLRQAHIAERLQRIAAKRKSDAIAREAKLNGIIGGACRADEAIHHAVKAALDHHVKDAKIREFLVIEGWLPAGGDK